MIRPYLPLSPRPQLSTPQSASPKHPKVWPKRLSTYPLPSRLSSRRRQRRVSVSCVSGVAIRAHLHLRCGLPGISFEALGNAIGRDEVWVAAAFYGQAKIDQPTLAKLAEALSLPLTTLTSTSSGPNGESHAGLTEEWYPNRGGLGPMPPTDPVIYRLYEGLMVYGYPIKVCFILARSLSKLWLIRVHWIGHHSRKVWRRDHVPDQLQGACREERDSGGRQGIGHVRVRSLLPPAFLASRTYISPPPRLPFLSFHFPILLSSPHLFSAHYSHPCGIESPC